MTKIFCTSHSKTHTWKNYVAIVVISCPFSWFLEGLKLLWTSACFEVRWLHFWHNLKCWFSPPLHHPWVRLACDWTPLCNFTNSYFSVTFWRTFSILICFPEGVIQVAHSECCSVDLSHMLSSPHKAVFWTVLTELTNKQKKRKKRKNKTPHNPRVEISSFQCSFWEKRYRKVTEDYFLLQQW